MRMKMRTKRRERDVSKSWSCFLGSAESAVEPANGTNQLQVFAQAMLACCSAIVDDNAGYCRHRVATPVSCEADRAHH